MMNERFDRVNCEKKEKRCDQCQIKKLTSMKKREEKKEMSMTEKTVRENESELKMIEFEQEMKQQRELTFEKMKLQSTKMLEILMLEKRLKE